MVLFPIHGPSGDIVLEMECDSTVADARAELSDAVRAPCSLISLLDEDSQTIMDDTEILGEPHILYISDII